MSSIPIDHLGRDDLIILLNRVAARLSTVPGNHHPVGTPHTPISYESRTYATSNDIFRPSVAANRGWRLRYEEEHDPWNAHLRCELRASISDTTAYASQTGPRTFSSSSWNQGLHDVLPTTTRLTDAMTYRYNQVAALDSEQMLLKAQWPGLGLRVTFVIVLVPVTTAAAYAAYVREATRCISA